MRKQVTKQEFEEAYWDRPEIKVECNEETHSPEGKTSKRSFFLGMPDINVLRRELVNANNLTEYECYEEVEYGCNKMVIFNGEFIRLREKGRGDNFFNDFYRTMFITLMAEIEEYIRQKPKTK